MGSKLNNVESGKVAAEVSVDQEDTKMLPQSLQKDNESLKRVLWKNIVAANASTFIFITGFMPLMSLQSSMNSKNSLGTIASSIVFASIAGACFLSTAALERFGTKTVLLFGTSAGITFISANFYPTELSMFPAAIITGMGFGFGQLALRTYTAKIGHQYTNLFKTGADRIQSRLSALTFILQRGGGLVGGMISSLILGIQTASFHATKEKLAICGANYCNENLKEFSNILNGTNYHNWTTDETEVQYADGTSTRFQVYSYLVFAIATVIVAVIIVFFFVTSLPKLGLSDKSENRLGVFQLLTGTLRQHTDVRLLLLIPLIMTPYVNDAFWHADFFKAYVTCSIGMHNIGYVSVWSSVASIASSSFFGWFNSKKFRRWSFTLATVVQGATAVALLYHKQSSSNYLTLSVYSGVYYIGSGIRQSLIPALICVVFKDNLTIALSNLQLWSATGGALVFGFSNYICMQTKLYILMLLLVISYVLYIIFEIRLTIASKKQTNHQEIVSS